MALETTNNIPAICPICHNKIKFLNVDMFGWERCPECNTIIMDDWAYGYNWNKMKTLGGSLLCPNNI